MLKSKVLGYMVTIRCPLNCKLCSAKVKDFKKKGMVWDQDLNNYYKGVDELFRIYDYIENFDFLGGETLLYTDLPECVKYTSKYRDHFKKMRIITNGTQIPSEDLIRQIKDSKCDFEFIVDNYGTVSNKCQEVISLLKAEKVGYREKVYFGNSQHCDGWVDYGDASFKNYTDDQVKHVFQTCHLAQYMRLTVYDDVLYNCIEQIVMIKLGLIHEPIEQEYFSLIDTTMSLDEKIEIASKFGKKIRNSCYYCNGMDSENATRFPAGEQAIT